MLPRVNSDEYLKYDPYRTFKEELDKKQTALAAGKMAAGSVEKGVLSKLLFGGASTVFTLELSDKLYSSFWKYVSELREADLMREMIRHAVIHQQSVKCQVTDILVLFWYLAYIPVAGQLETLQNPIRLNTMKTIGKSFLHAVQKGSVSAYFDRFAEEERLEEADITSYVVKRAAISICVFLYHLALYGALDKPVDDYLNWLVDSGFQWFKLPKTVTNDTLYSSAHYLIPAEVPVTGGRPLGSVYKHFEDYAEIYRSTYADCGTMDSAVTSILKHKDRKLITPWVD